MNVKSKSVRHLVFRAPNGRADWPYSENEFRPNMWLIRHYHGLDMNFGVTEYESLADYIFSTFCCHN